MSTGQPPASVAFYLPQFHPIPENDRWWGQGFTEWTNVRAAKPLFRGHHQPRVPERLGYYDLRDPDIRAQQADLAQQFGIAAFCYYHYWFNGHRLLERPFDEVLSSGQPDFPFMICWANENWTRVWDGGERNVLIEQKYSDRDDLDHFRVLAPALADPRYVTLDGRPVLLVYKIGLLPDAARTADTWRAEADRLGLAPPYLCSVESAGDAHRDPRSYGFDAAVEFAPQPRHLPKWRRTNHVLESLAAKSILPRRFGHHIFRYDAIIERLAAKPAPDHPWFRAITPGWDNTPRRRTGGLIIRDSTPERFEQWATDVLRESAARHSEFVFINAWNEWAEGAYLEPDQQHGTAYLEAHLRARAAALGGT